MILPVTRNQTISFLVQHRHTVCSRRNFRRSASANSEALNKVPKGRTVTFISDAGNDESGYHFFKVYYLGQMGYVMSSYLEYVA